LTKIAHKKASILLQKSAKNSKKARKIAKKCDNEQNKTRKMAKLKNK
jgi:hypothetical protein